MTSASASRARTAVVPALYRIANVAIAVSAASLLFYWLFSRVRAA